MGLRAEAERILSEMIENTDHFGSAVSLVAPNGSVQELTALVNDISAAVDPQTGAIVSGRQVTCALRMSSLATLPTAVADVVGKPWVLQITDILGVTRSFKIRETIPDRTIGVLVCICEAYNAN
jgi:ABC-type branched-subunit amino acid transport system ATPase component